MWIIKRIIRVRRRIQLNRSRPAHDPTTGFPTLDINQKSELLTGKIKMIFLVSLVGLTFILGAKIWPGY
jgi:hypothetical protein